MNPPETEGGNSYEPKAGIRFALIALAFGLFVVISLATAGPLGLFLVPLSPAAGWISVCGALFGSGKIAGFVMIGLGGILGLGGLGLYFGARRPPLWALGCALLAILLFGSLHGCAKMGKFIDG